ncbi:unnamed protein product [Blepharisma stoltei]|uniref:TPX2 central domain-containing protein n=1 Tax=Blepharisma stoltei TaxID=1481888 RepID=A0AAU9JGH1_9CILI|nr:unnamed protein product [Blepharisma stoltei]
MIRFINIGRIYMLDNIVNTQRSSSVKHAERLSQSSHRESISTASDTPSSTLKCTKPKPVKLMRAIPLNRIKAFEEPEIQIKPSKTSLIIDTPPKSCNENEFVYTTHLSPLRIPSPDESMILISTTQIPKKKKAKRLLISEEKDITYIRPTHIELIQGLKKIRSLTLPFPFAPELQKPDLPFSLRSRSARKHFKKNKIEYIVPKNPIELGTLLKKMKETERVLRQENNFSKKIRNLKPEIQLTEIQQDNSVQKKKKHNKSFEIHGGRIVKPCIIPNSGLIIQNTKSYNSYEYI